MVPEGNDSNIGGTRVEELMGGEAERSVPVSFEKLEVTAREHLDGDTFDYVSGGAGGEQTVSGNREAFDSWRIRPAMLRGISEVDLEIDLLGIECDVPLWLAPVGLQTMFHEDGEVATASAAADTNVPLILSSASSKPLEAVAEQINDTPHWFQLYPCADQAVTESLVSRAETAGYGAIVITVDTPSFAWRERDLENQFHPTGGSHRPANYFTDPNFRAGLDTAPEDDLDSAYDHFNDLFLDPELDWETIGNIAGSTDLPVLLKGILRADDARHAIKCGADGVIVSNHGGRQVDRAIPSLHALPEVADAVGDDVPVLLDGGVRRGSEAFIAYALGADAVCVGRPYLYGLAIAGADGVTDVLANLLTDIHSVLAQTGHESVSTVDRDTVARISM
jgi:isopentenyl diphosphate isomerase/L-lactate dehydrogenase-like FMN-dependent dehydrogenase